MDLLSSMTSVAYGRAFSRSMNISCASPSLSCSANVGIAAVNALLLS